MNYYEYLNKAFETNQGQNIAQNLIKYQPNANPFAQSVFNGNNAANTVNVNGVSIFEKATKEDVNKIDYDKLTAEVDAENPQKLSPLEFVLKVFMSIDEVKKKADKDGNGEISKEEAKEMVKDLVAKDGNAEDLSLEDFEAVLKENNVDLDALLAKELADSEQIGEEAATADDYAAAGSAADAGYADSVGGAAPADYSPAPSGNYDNYNATAEEFASVDGSTLEELQAEKATRENTLKEKQNALNAVYNGENANVKAAKDEMNKAQKEYEKALTEDEGAKQFAPQVIKNNENIAKNEENINKNAKAITDKENEITTAESSLTSLTGELETLEATLSALPALSGKEEDKEKDAQITAKKSELESAISAKKEEISKQTEQVENLKKELEELNKEKAELEKEKQDLEEEKQNLDEQVKKHCNEITKAKLEAFNKSKENYETVKAKELESAKAEVQKAQDAVKEIDTKIAEKKAIETTKKYAAAQGGDLKPGLFKGALAGKEDVVNQLCHKYGLDPALVASIIGLESGWGTSNLARHNNFMGYRKAGDAGVSEKGFGYFSTPEKGLEAAISNLARYTRFSDVASVDFNNLDQIGRHYCEGGEWSGKIRNVYNSRVQRYIA